MWLIAVFLTPRDALDTWLCFDQYLSNTWKKCTPGKSTFRAQFQHFRLPLTSCQWASQSVSVSQVD